jgi:hypothetical protein
VGRPQARELLERVEITAVPGGAGLLDGACVLTVELSDGRSLSTSLDQPPGSPGRPPTEAQLAAKLADCAPDVLAAGCRPGWADAADLLATALPAGE